MDWSSFTFNEHLVQVYKLDGPPGLFGFGQSLIIFTAYDLDLGLNSFLKDFVYFRAENDIIGRYVTG
jgi:hypothetical protein